MISSVVGDRTGYDINPYLIALLKTIRDCPETLPKNNKELTESDYMYLKKNHKTLNEDMWPLIGFAGFFCGFAGEWFRGYARNKMGDDYVARGYRTCLRDHLFLKDCAFECRSYEQLEFAKSSVIYCDPPYFGLGRYREKINHDHFWQWCRDRASEGHQIFVSEASAPSDFKCVWEGDILVRVSPNQSKSSTRPEKLFTL
jgi:DNA adenine methylase